MWPIYTHIWPIYDPYMTHIYSYIYNILWPIYDPYITLYINIIWPIFDPYILIYDPYMTHIWPIYTHIWPTYITYITCSTVVLSTVLTAGWLSYGKCEFWPPYSSAPNEPIKMAFGTRDYVMETTPHANFYQPTLITLPPGMGWNITYVSVTFFFFCASYDKPCAHTSRPIFTIYAPNDVISLLVVPFGGRNFEYLKFRGVLPQKVPKKGRG